MNPNRSIAVRFILLISLIANLTIRSGKTFNFVYF